MNPIIKQFSTNPKDYRALRLEWFDIASIFDDWKKSLSDQVIQVSIYQAISLGYIESINIVDVEVTKVISSNDEPINKTTDK